mmetsp:Transcript_14076/g.24060  ORF Transcript_14076/g.24060 Transcript_14076/m.24060 type:complete len:180 (+) Transcript_14076:294-833(+)|eukprot:CAMPEP_0184693246 /NCGR_PEP_ID=MMETSP0313-20130426/1515_1 /TAXON_ID=2792 /ORGANISM="Porphyridium aerugineum, Strain SAG 1380-2" /LENGTH=179 /DNA_ID=CAMNT_0027151275 /DNA_START=112 /DNA_END=651 /DNA_ORIENTATION=-
MFTLKRQVKESQDRKAAGSETSKQSPAELRAQKDISQIDVPPSMKLTFPDPNTIMSFDVAFTPEDGLYTAGTFRFNISIPVDYPHSAPKVKCMTKVYHPNIDMDGNVCLNILRQDWKPVLTLNAVLYGIQLLFSEPNPEDPLNKEAAELMRKNPAAFRQNVLQSVRGGYVSGVYYPKAS